MRIVVISDTHGQHEKLGTLHGDVLIHCGDVELLGAEPGALGAIDDWFGRQHFERIFCIGGNHDAEVQRKVRVRGGPFRNATWLHERTVTHRGVTFHGASWVPMLEGLPFFADDELLERAWSRIPTAVDVLVTHTPPRGVLDVSGAGQRLGCPLLARRVEELSPRLHCFGHVHRSAGHVTRGGTTYVNATSVNSRFELVRQPFVFELPD